MLLVSSGGVCGVVNKKEEGFVQAIPTKQRAEIDRSKKNSDIISCSLVVASYS